MVDTRLWWMEEAVPGRILGVECIHSGRLARCHMGLDIGAGCCSVADAKKAGSLATVADMVEVERGHSERSGS